MSTANRKRSDRKVHQLDALRRRDADLRYDQPGLSASRLATLAGVTLQAVRYYTRLGLLRSTTVSDINLKRFMPHELRRLQFIQGMRRLGCCLKDITQLLILSEQQQIDAQALVTGLDRVLTPAQNHMRIERAQLRLLRQACNRWRSPTQAYVQGRDLRNLIVAFASIDVDQC